MESAPTPLTNDVRLRDVIKSDLRIFFDQQLDPESARMAAFPIRRKGEFMGHWQKILADPAIIKKTILFGGNVAGNIVCFEQDSQSLVGYWLGKQYWGKGIATRALAAFLERVTARPLYAYVARHNIASRRVLDKCGFTIYRENEAIDGVYEIILKFD